ncbi:hypothetical protein [Clostridium sp.]
MTPDYKIIPGLYAVGTDAYTRWLLQTKKFG